MTRLHNILIDDRGLYEYCLTRKYDPLCDSRFIIPIALRIQIQYDRFKTNEQFYRYFWDNCKIRHCQECEHPLTHYSAKYCSHILSRGSHPLMRYDFRNMNLLCLKCHHKWESEKKVTMNIYPKNIKIITKLKFEYNIEWN